MKTRTLVILDDGREVDLDECDWLRFAPCGCPSGVAVARYIGADEDKVWDEFTATSNKRLEIERDKAAGFSHRLITHTEYVEKWLDIFKASCPHTPMWGIEPDPEVPGYLWAADRGSYRHLVEAERVADTTRDRETREQKERPKMTDGPALCGGGQKFAMWTNRGGYLHSETNACAKCCKKARQIAPLLIEEMTV